MKSFNYYLLFLGGIIIMSATEVLSNDDEVTKTIKKEFSYHENTQLMINNKFGSIDVKDWDENSISLEVIITVEHPRKEKAEEMLGYVNVVIEEEGNLIKVSTVFDDKLNENFNNSSDRKFSINYNIYVPRQITLSLSNKYGDIFLNQLEGIVDVQLAYGNLKAGKLLRGDEKPLNKMDLAYGSATIDECMWLKVNMKYSKLFLNQSEALVIVSKYSSINIDKGSSLVAESKYDNYQLGDFVNMVCNTSYSNLKISSIQNKFVIEGKYTDSKIDYVPRDFKLIEIDSKYGKVNIGIDQAANYKISGVSQYGKIICPDQGKVSCVDQSNSYTVLGYVGTDEDTPSQVKISASYCTVKLTE